MNQRKTKFIATLTDGNENVMVVGMVVDGDGANWYSHPIKVVLVEAHWLVAETIMADLLNNGNNFDRTIDFRSFIVTEAATTQVDWIDGELTERHSASVWTPEYIEAHRNVYVMVQGVDPTTNDAAAVMMGMVLDIQSRADRSAIFYNHPPYTPTVRKRWWSRITEWLRKCE